MSFCCWLLILELLVFQDCYFLVMSLFFHRCHWQSGCVWWVIAAELITVWWRLFCVSIVVTVVMGSIAFIQLLFSSPGQWSQCQSSGLDGVPTLWLLIQSHLAQYRTDLLLSGLYITFLSLLFMLHIYRNHNGNHQFIFISLIANHTGGREKLEGVQAKNVQPISTHH